MQLRLEKCVTRFLVFKVRFRLVFMALVVLCMLGLLFTYHIHSDVRYCFMSQQQQALKSQSNLPTTDSSAGNLLQPLDDVLLSAHKPKPGRSIFFHETSCHQPQRSGMDAIFGSLSMPTLLAQLTARQACAVESAALHNPNFGIFVLFASPAYHDNSTTAAPSALIDAILAYPNVNLRNLNLWTYAADTPISAWLNDGDLFKSRYVLSHISDFLRYLSLWRFGGTYMDMDVIVLRSLEDVPPNYTGAESDTHLAAGVMNFAPTGFGHEVAQRCLHDFQRNFDGDDWGNNGPGVITRVMQRICDTPSIASMLNRESCRGFHVFACDAFYAIPWREWEHFFEAQYLEETLKRTKSSYVVHVWNKHSKQRRVKVGSNAAYGKLAEQHCPKVYAAAGEFF